MAYKIVCLILIASTCHSHPYGPHGSLSSPSKGGVQELVPFDSVSLGHSGSLDGLGGSKAIVEGQNGQGGVTGGSSQGGYGGFGNKNVGAGYNNKDIDGGMKEVDLGHGPSLNGPVGGYSSRDMVGGTGALEGSSFVPISTQDGYNGQREDKGLTGGYGGSLDKIGGGYNGNKDMGGRGDIGGYSIIPSSSRGGYGGKDGANIGGGYGGSIEGLGRGHGSKDIIGGQSDRYIFGSTASDGAYAGEPATEEGIREISYGNDGLIAIDSGEKDLDNGRSAIAGYNSGSQGGKNKIPGQGASEEYSSIPVMRPAGGQDGRGFDDVYGSGLGGYRSHSREQSSGGYIDNQDGLGGGYGGNQHKIQGSSTQDESAELGGHRGFSGDHGGSQGEIVGGNYGGVREQRGFGSHGSSGYGNHGHIGSGNGGYHRHGGYGRGGYSHGC